MTGQTEQAESHWMASQALTFEPRLSKWGDGCCFHFEAGVKTRTLSWIPLTPWTP